MRRKRFRNRILLYLIGATLPPVFFLAVLFYRNSLRDTSRAYEQQLNQAAEIVRLQSERWANSNQNMVNFLAREIGSHRRSTWVSILEHAVLAESGAYVAHIMDKNGDNVARSDGRPPMNYWDRQYFHHGIRGDVYSEPLIAKIYRRPALCTGGPIYVDGELKYAVGLCSFLEKLSESIGAIHIGRTGHAVLVDESGRILAHPEISFLGQLTDDEEKSFLDKNYDETSRRIEFAKGNVPYVGYVYKMSNGWRAVAFQSKEEILQLAKENLKWPLIGGGLLFLLLALLIFFAVDYSTAPLNRLTQVVRRFGQGDLDARALSESTDELGLLAENFNLMAQRIRATIEELKGKEFLLERHRDELHQKVIEQSQKLLYSAKMSSLGEMAGGIAHEINNPLAIISLKAQQLQEGLSSGQLGLDEAARLAEQIDGTCLRIHKIIRGLRAFSHDGSRDPMISENLSSILAEVEGLCSESLRARQIQLEINCPPEISLKCQPVPLSQVFMNLILNSRDAIAELPEKWIRIDCSQEGDRILIRLTDSGFGIPEPVRSQMMQPFFTTKEVGEGTGLGLSICKGIVGHHKGKIVYNSDSERTQFLIALPISQETQTTPHEATL
jgi:signal transduction histidine kinase